MSAQPLNKRQCPLLAKDKTLWGSCFFKLELIFPNKYLNKPRKGKFVPPLFLLNVYPSGTVCLSGLNERKAGGRDHNQRDTT
jgi:ubiquitin-protein ligase